jgi:NAD(P)-dependent dehydrogenase (short-subunit alcohol dehydrogenase family)
MDRSSHGKTIVLTGATRGLGRAMAHGFIAGGHTVLGCGRDAVRIRELQRTCGGPHDFQAIDVADGAAVARWGAALLSRHGAPDLLINNAAITLEPQPLWKVAEEDFSRVIDINIKGVVNVIRAFLPAMLRAGRGVIVNFSSGWGRTTDANVAPYCATKWAIEGLTQALAQELPAGLSAVALNPGIINTDMLLQCFGESASQYPSPEEWARSAVPFLLALGPKQNGQSLSVPGAMLE